MILTLEERCFIEGARAKRILLLGAVMHVQMINSGLELDRKRNL